MLKAALAGYRKKGEWNRAAPLLFPVLCADNNRSKSVNAKLKISVVVVCILRVLSPWFVVNVLAEGDGPFHAYLPYITRTGDPTLSDLIKQKIEKVLIASGNPLTLTVARVAFDGHSLTL